MEALQSEEVHKFYLFCGFKQTQDNKEKFYNDIWELFQRIKILMQYGCVGYVMRHEDYHQAPIANIYIQIARWCNQQAFYKKCHFGNSVTVISLIGKNILVF